MENDHDVLIELRTDIKYIVCKLDELQKNQGEIRKEFDKISKQSNKALGSAYFAVTLSLILLTLLVEHALGY